MSDAWSYVPLADVAHINMGQSPPSITVNEDGSGVPFLQGNAEFGSRHPAPTKFCTKPQKQARSGDILLSVRAPVGAVNLADKPVCIGRGLSAITATGVDPGFLWHVVRKQAAGLVRVAQGSTFAAVNRADLCALSIPLPTRPEQRKIAAILASVDEAIEKTQAVMDQVQVVKRGLMQELFTRGLPGRHAQFVETEIGEIPREWRIRRLRDAGSWLSGGTPSRQNIKYWNGSIPWISGKDMKRTRLHDAVEHVSEASVGNGTRIAGKGAILMVVRGMILAHTFPVALTLTDVTFNQDLKALIANDSYEPEFLLYWLEHRDWRILSLVDTASHGTKRLSSQRLFAELIPCPEREEQERIAQILRQCDSYTDTTSTKLQGLTAVKSALMSVLLTGELRVTPDPDPEPE